VSPKNDCPPPININYGSSDVKYLETGTIARYHCLEGFILKGNPEVHCNLITHIWPIKDIPYCG